MKGKTISTETIEEAMKSIVKIKLLKKEIEDELAK